MNKILVVVIGLVTIGYPAVGQSDSRAKPPLLEAIFIQRNPDIYVPWPEGQAWYKEVKANSNQYCPFLIEELSVPRIVTPERFPFDPKIYPSAASAAETRFRRSVMAICRICDPIWRESLVAAFLEVGAALDQDQCDPQTKDLWVNCPARYRLEIAAQDMVEELNKWRDTRLRDAILDRFEKAYKASQLKYLSYLHRVWPDDPAVKSRLESLMNSPLLRNAPHFWKFLKRPMPK